MAVPEQDEKPLRPLHAVPKNGGYQTRDKWARIVGTVLLLSQIPMQWFLREVNVPILAAGLACLIGLPYAFHVGDRRP